MEYLEVLWETIYNFAGTQPTALGTLTVNRAMGYLVEFQPVGNALWMILMGTRQGGQPGATFIFLLANHTPKTERYRTRY